MVFRFLVFATMFAVGAGSLTTRATTEKEVWKQFAQYPATIHITPQKNNIDLSLKLANLILPGASADQIIAHFTHPTKDASLFDLCSAQDQSIRELIAQKLLDSSDSLDDDIYTAILLCSTDAKKHVISFSHLQATRDFRELSFISTVATDPLLRQQASTILQQAYADEVKRIGSDLLGSGLTIKSRALSVILESVGVIAGLSGDPEIKSWAHAVLQLHDEKTSIIQYLIHTTDIPHGLETIKNLILSQRLGFHDIMELFSAWGHCGDMYHAVCDVLVSHGITGAFHSMLEASPFKGVQFPTSRTELDAFLKQSVAGRLIQGMLGFFHIGSSSGPDMSYLAKPQNYLPKTSVKTEGNDDL